MKTNLKIAWRNLWRNRRRTLITVASIFFGVLFSAYMTSMQEGSYKKMVEIVVKFYSGYLQVHHQDYWENKSLNNSFDYRPGLADSISRHREVEMVFPRLESFALASSENLTKGAMIFGIDPVREDQWTGISNRIQTGRYLLPGDRGVVIGQGLAAYLNVGLNDTLVMIGQGFHGVAAAGKFPIRGLVTHASPELNKLVVYMDLSTCQEFFSMPGKITSLVVNVENNQAMRSLLRKLTGEVAPPLAVMSWEEMQPEIVQQIESDRASGMLMKAILYLVIGFGILATMMMMIAERKKEFGVMVAVGMQKSRLAAILFFETLFIGILGIITGIIVSYQLILFQVAHPIPLTGQTASVMEEFGFEPFIFFSSATIVFTQQAITIFLLTLLISVYPAWAAARLKVIRLLHA